MTNSFAVACKELPRSKCIVREMQQSYTCAERATAINIKNDTHDKVLFIELDGGLFRGNACDWGVCDEEYVVGSLIELKGRDVEHAIQQLKTTCTRLRNEFTGVPQIRRAYIVSRQNHISSGWQNFVKKFRKDTGVRLERCKSNRTPLTTKELFSA